MTTSQHTARVGFIGLGDQGAPMAQAIGDSGFGHQNQYRGPRTARGRRRALNCGICATS